MVADVCLIRIGVDGHVWLASSVLLQALLENVCAGLLVRGCRRRPPSVAAERAEPAWLPLNLGL